MVFALPKLLGGGSSDLQPLRVESRVEQPNRKPEKLCDLWGDGFRAQLGSHGASLERFELTTAKYQKKAGPIDVSTTAEVETRQQLRFSLRNEAAGALTDKAWQTDWDLLDFELLRADGKTCEFRHATERLELIKSISVGEHPYELVMSAKLTNKSGEKRRHAATVDTTAWRRTEEVKGNLFSQSPFITHVECAPTDGKVLRKLVTDFGAKSFSEPEFAASNLNQGDWMNSTGTVAYAAVANSYFAHALMPLSAPAAPACQLRIEEWFDPQLGRDRDSNAGAMYRARLAYPPQELAPGASAEYRVASYIGPKEREALLVAGGGQHRLSELIDLGFFSAIAKVLVGFLLAVHGVLPNWGLAIILLTLTAKVLTFPLSLPMIKSSIKMRELKPELDALNEKFKDDAQAKGLAQMELWRKHNVNPVKGCLPQMASMPIWFALYTTLQTAVELYNIPFLWFPDLSAPDPYYILPFVIGGTNFLQQKMMPMTGGDPAQQKMMLYVMPAMFTVFMLFLPAGLGVYMFTNGVLGILQQQGVEWYVRRSTGLDRDGKPRANIEVKLEPTASKALGGKAKTEA
jgi:YidC/Oxa1 family membrane protein insertase